MSLTYDKLKFTIQSYIKEQMNLGWALFAIGDAQICVTNVLLEPFFKASFDDDKKFLVIHQRENPLLEIKIPLHKLPDNVDLGIVNKTIEGCSGDIAYHKNGICLLLQFKDHEIQIFAIPSNKFFIHFNY